ncbi:MAG: M42 family peptidase [Oscillospiraceae bacterium]
MIELLKELCAIDGVSGREEDVRKFIMEKIKSHAEVKLDGMGNIIAFKKGKMSPKNKIVFDAHMDEVGLIVTSITDDGYLRFTAVGGIDVSVMIARRVVFQNGAVGVIGAKPIHMVSEGDRKKLPKKEDLLIDIGAPDKSAALQIISIGDTASFDNGCQICDELIKAKAIDDRAGCAVLIKMLEEPSECDFYATFCVQEEVGLRGAKAAMFSVNPDIAVVLEATTAADIEGVDESKRVCALGNGVAVSFMDGATLYDKKLYELAMKTAQKSNIKCQPKASVTGGNNAGSINVSGDGVRTMGLSVPCRYIHSPSSVANCEDIKSMYFLAKALLPILAQL